ncbi:MAG: hypothetical protein V2B13_06570 [Pseudomonadota bacterium]
MWKRFDSNHYLSIAQNGYSYYPCSAEEHFGLKAWCGTSGWFPGYPLLIKAASILFPSLEWAAIFISAILHLGTLILLWNGFFHSFWKRENILCLLLAAFFPGQVYHHAIFPISLMTFCALLFLYFMKKHNRFGAGLAAAAACFSYPPGFLLLGIGFLYLLIQKRFRTAVLLVCLGSLGLVMVVLVFQLQVGHWDAYLKIHHKYDHQFSNPLTTFSHAIQPLFRLESWWPSGKISLVSFRTHEGYFFCAENQDLLANRTVPGDWETFERFALGGEKVALRAHTGLFLCTSKADDQTILVRCPKIESGAIFHEVKGDSDLIGLRTPKGHFLCPDEGDKKLPVRATCSNLEKSSLLKKESRTGSRSQQQAIMAGQTAFLFCLLLILLFSTLYRRPQLRSIDILLVLFTAAFWLFHFSLGSSLSLYRAESLLLPSIFLGRYLPSKFLMALLFIEIVLAFHMGQLFFRYVLI